MIELANDAARLVVLPERGGLIASVRVGDLELLRTEADDVGGTHWGCFVMAPWAGRTRDARFTFRDVEHELPANAGRHAIHGTVRNQVWNVEHHDTNTLVLSCPFGPDWPFAGHVEHVIRLFPTRVALMLTLHAEDGPMPAIGGWHPWWRRRLDRGGPAALDLPVRAMLRRDEEHIATLDLVSPIPPGPWDDCFLLEGGESPVLRWPGALELAVESTCDWVVVYDEPADAVCVEPQSAPPDALNHVAPVARPGSPLVIESNWRWHT